MALSLVIAGSSIYCVLSDHDFKGKQTHLKIVTFMHLVASCAYVPQLLGSSTSLSRLHSEAVRPHANKVKYNRQTHTLVQHLG